MNINDSKLWDPQTKLCAQIVSWVKLHFKSKQEADFHYLLPIFCAVLFGWCTGGLRINKKKIIPSARTDRLRKINLVMPVRVYYKTSSFAKYIESLFELSSTKKYFNHLNDTSTHYSLQPATSSAELAAFPRSQPILTEGLIDDVQWDSASQTCVANVHTHFLCPEQIGNLIKFPYSWVIISAKCYYMFSLKHSTVP